MGKRKADCTPDEWEKMLAAKRKYYEANPEKLRERNRKYREANPEKVRERDRKWRNANPDYFRKYREANLDKERERDRKYHEANLDKERERNRKYREANREKVRERVLKRTYGLTMQDYKSIHSAQKGVCLLCGQPETSNRNGKVKHLAVDHCHHTGTIRGLLCSQCNTTLHKIETGGLDLAHQLYAHVHPVEAAKRGVTLKPPKRPITPVVPPVFTKDAEQQLKRKYNLAVDQYMTMWHAQHGLCRCCHKAEIHKDPTGKLRRLAVEHNHHTGEVRGLTCNACNSAIASIDKHGPAWLWTAIEYLCKHWADEFGLSPEEYKQHIAF